VNRVLLMAAVVLAAVPPVARAVTVTHAGGMWTIHGQKNTVELNEHDLAVTVHSGPADWKMVPSGSEDMLVSAASDRFWVRLADAQDIRIAPYQTGFKTGVRMILEGFRGTGQVAPGAPLDLRVVLTMCLEGAGEELVSEAMVNEGATGSCCRGIGPSRIIPSKGPRGTTASSRAI